MIIVSGPSTVGKNPLIYGACKIYNLEYIVPYTTRAKRKEEKNGIDYCFFNKNEFQKQILSRKIKEWDFALDNYYGYDCDFSKKGDFITHSLSRMALRIKAKYPDNVTTVFLMPDDNMRILDNLKHIYTGRELILRQALVEEELCHSLLFDEVFNCPINAIDLLRDNKLKEILVR